MTALRPFCLCWATGILVCFGCSKPVEPMGSSNNPNRGQSAPAPGSTLDDVRTITAKQMGVAVTKISKDTSLGDLGADDLDFVELVMELEEHFNISIPDEAAERMTGSKSGKEGLNNVTMEKLSGVIDDRRGK
jgi:acyl carrier protein